MFTSGRLFLCLLVLLAVSASTSSGQHSPRGYLGGPYGRMARDSYQERSQVEPMEYVESSYESLKTDKDYSPYAQRQDWSRIPHKSKMVKKFSEFIGGK